jgi:hypothetical protein
MDEFDASDPKQVQDRKTALGRQRVTDEQVVKLLLSTEPGRSWVWRQLEFCHVFAQSFDGEALGTAFNEGQRSVGLRLIGEVTRADPEAYVLMMREAADGRYAP